MSETYSQGEREERIGEDKEVAGRRRRKKKEKQGYRGRETAR
jgi:hypothetical protein